MCLRVKDDLRSSIISADYDMRFEFRELSFHQSPVPHEMLP